MPKPNRRKPNADLKRFEQIIHANRFLGLWKDRPLPLVIEQCSLLTQEPSVPISWEQIAAMYNLLCKICGSVDDEEGCELDEFDISVMMASREVLGAFWDYLKNHSKKKGLIENALMAERLERENAERESGDPQAETGG